MTVSTGSLRCAILLALAALPGCAQGGTQPTSPHPNHPAKVHDSMKSLIKAFAGSWAIRLSSDGSRHGVPGIAGEGEEVWRAGPGSNSLIEEYHSKGTEGEMDGLGIFWRDESEKVFKVFWCDNTTSAACRTLENKVDWNEGRLVLSEERSKDGRKHLFQEVFAFDTPDSFTQTLAEGEPGGSLRTFLTIRATRKKP